MKRFFKDRIDFYLFVSAVLFAVVLFLWLKPHWFGLVSDTYSIAQFRSDLQALSSLFYIVINMWLVLLTRKSADISLNTQKALNRPSLHCQLYISDSPPNSEVLTDTRTVIVRNISGGEYSPHLGGAYIFLLVRNRYNSGNAIGIGVSGSLEAQDPARISIPITSDSTHLAGGDTEALYLYRFDQPTYDATFLNLTDLKIRFTTPFNEASGDDYLEISYTQNNKISVVGNMVSSVRMGDRIQQTS